MTHLRAIARDWIPAFDASEVFRRGLGEPDEWQKKFLRSSSKRILAVTPRQSGKSAVASSKAVHRLLFVPGSLVLLVSVSQKQASELLRTVKTFYRPFSDLFPVETESVLQLELRNGSRVLSLPSDSSTVRGFSAAALIILDEASRIKDDVFSAISPIVAVSGGTLILLSTPSGRRGFFHAEFQSGGDQWEPYVIKECPRHSAEFLARELARMGPKTYAEEYQAAFVEDAEDARNPRVFAGREALLDRVFGGPAAL